jgi:hypothetical protein
MCLNIYLFDDMDTPAALNLSSISDCAALRSSSTFGKRLRCLCLMYVKAENYVSQRQNVADINSTRTANCAITAYSFLTIEQKSGVSSFRNTD